MGAAAILLALAGVARGADGGASADPGARATGVLCLRKLPPSGQFATAGKGSAIPEHYEDTPEARERRVSGHPQMEVRVDGVAPVIIDQKAGACIDGLALDVKHVVKSGPPGFGEAARFSFAPGQTVLELRYEPFYGHIQINPPSRRAAPPVGVASCAVCPNGSPVKKKMPDAPATGGLAGHPPAPRAQREPSKKDTSPDPQPRPPSRARGEIINDCSGLQ
jgi:hypothetical protein